LREKARNCDFPNEEDRTLEHIIQTTENKSHVKKASNHRWTLTEMLQQVHQIEETTLQVSGMQEKYSDVAKV